MKKIYTLWMLIITQGLSLIGSRMTSMALALWIFKNTGNATYLLLVPFFNEIPMMLFGGLAGIFVDRWSRKKAMILGDFGQFVGSLLLLLTLVLGGFKISILYVVVFMQGFFSMFQGPAADAATTMLTPKEYREKINGVKQMIFPLAGIMAPAFTGFLYPLVGLVGIIVIDMMTFLISVAVLFKISIPDPVKEDQEEGKQEGFLEEFKIGLKYLVNQKGLMSLILYYSFINFLLNGPLDLVIAYSTRLFNEDLFTSMLMSVMSIGAFSGALLLSIWGGTKIRIHTIMIGMLITGGFLIIFGITRAKVLLFIALFILMMPLPITGALITSIVQVKIPPYMQGRVFALMSQLSFVATPVSFLITGPIVDKILEPNVGKGWWKVLEPMFGVQPGVGMGFLLSFTGLIIITVTIIAYSSPRVRRLEKETKDYEI